MTALETARLVLRQWQPTDRPLFAALNADAEVMRFFPAPLDRRSSDEFAARCEQRIARRGWGLWAVALKEGGEFIGFVGLETPGHDLPFGPCTEVGWRLAKRYWGRGYATEAACAAILAGFERLQCEEIVSFTSVLNAPSRRVMEKLGMVDSGENFLHPAIADGHPLQEHCLYRLTRAMWQSRQAGNGAA